MAIDASCLRKFDEPPAAPLREKEPPPSHPAPPKLGRPPPPLPLPPLPPWNWKPPVWPGAPAAPRAPKPVHEPLELAVVTVIDRASMVVLDFFEGVPVTVTQSPAATALTASVTVLENCVVDVQLTVVWPEVVFWTSMFDALASSAATLPLAPSPRAAGGAVAAPAVELRAPAATS